MRKSGGPAEIGHIDMGLPRGCDGRDRAQRRGVQETPQKRSHRSLRDRFVNASDRHGVPFPLPGRSNTPTKTISSRPHEVAAQRSENESE